jgi:hypothetical protein
VLADQRDLDQRRELQLLSSRVMVPSKSVKKMIFGFASRVSGKGIVIEEMSDTGGKRNVWMSVAKGSRKRNKGG